jgi:hypothetical protein
VLGIFANPYFQIISPLKACANIKAMSYYDQNSLSQKQAYNPLFFVAMALLSIVFAGLGFLGARTYFSTSEATDTKKRLKASKTKSPSTLKVQPNSGGLQGGTNSQSGISPTQNNFPAQ